MPPTGGARGGGARGGGSRVGGSRGGGSRGGGGRGAARGGPAGRPDAVDLIVEQWAQERPELVTDAMAVFGRIYRIARLVAEQQEQVYAEHGINRAEFDVLATLRRSGPPFQLSPKALSDSMMLTSGAMTGRLDRLEGRGLLARSPDPDDRRALVITLTDAGRTLIDAAVGPGLAAQRRILEQLPPAGRAAVSDLLRDLLAAATAESHREGDVR